MLKNKANFLTSFKYILVSGASKGFNYILLFYLAVGIFSEQYITILLLLSLEQILSLLLPLNHSNIIYSKEVTSYKLISNKMTTNSIIITIFFLIIYLVLKKQVSLYFEVENMMIFLSLLVSMLINSYFVYLTNYFKIIEEHGKALLVQALLLISFLCIVVLMLILEDVVLAFFLGKALGLILAAVALKMLHASGFSYSISFLSKDELKKVFNLFSVSALGWLSGLGFLNLAKIYSTPDELVQIGYILNLYNIFLLISIGVNSIYAPLIKKNLLNNFDRDAIQIRSKTLMLYLVLAVLTALFYFILIYMGSMFNSKINIVISVMPFAILLFVFNSFNWVVQPFYLINDKFKNYNIINVLSYVIWILVMFICFTFGYRNFIVFLLVVHFLKGVFSFVYAEKNIIQK